MASRRGGIYYFIGAVSCVAQIFVAEQREMGYTEVVDECEGGIFVSEHEIDIADMQCWVFRMAQKKWKMPAESCAALFEKYDVLGFISECYGLLHLNSYNCALNDVETLLRNRGAEI